MFLLLAVSLALGSTREVEEDCLESQQTTLLQHGLHLGTFDHDSSMTLHRFRSLTRGSPVLPSPDVNGRMCLLCDMPPAERAPDKSYVQRSDCGNHSVFEHPEMALVPLSRFTKDATAERNETSGWCELNTEKACADALYNQDYMMFAKAIQIPKLPLVNYSAASWDQFYCYYNGWLSPEIKAMQHDFEGMKAKGKEYCDSDALVRLGSKGNMTLHAMLARWLPAAPFFPGSRPSVQDAHFIAAWTCAMGSAACDMAYCAYTYCVKEDGFGTYAECAGWDPVKGMPVDSVDS
ncbi:unnamed protein product [Symbiodinium pilosum]|uniref:Uncharacterized protein n=1 Tax=Symbiodinium pilosum TaxID=2952 RepID=A0A812PMT9_SYMPI|nr:unnamed protein product [Symbiodinium pilosum]